MGERRGELAVELRRAVTIIVLAAVEEHRMVPAVVPEFDIAAVLRRIAPEPGDIIAVGLLFDRFHDNPERRLQFLRGEIIGKFRETPVHITVVIADIVDLQDDITLLRILLVGKRLQRDRFGRRRRRRRFQFLKRPVGRRRQRRQEPWA